ncbi:Hypothetical protein LUCI_0270 [Lucifera butyrica]|uniref:Uncharacterized protein n=1 Tax=Lucifera butyrica TaxID=1351585 RepID=A0A498R0V0_9FIRM|nr:hypothetical protein [Lucifera butyrica]VBB05064.1 Hypothetical protein LUCI_0270 [Lucifera butyrica]
MFARKCLFLCLLLVFFAVGNGRIIEAAPQNDLITVTVHLTIENPDYFWQYPFAGKQLDGIGISGMGEKITLLPASSGQTLKFEVPEGYQFRLWLDFLSNSAVTKEVTFVKNNIDATNHTFTITLKAPLPQLPEADATGFDETTSRP